MSDESVAESLWDAGAGLVGAVGDFAGAGIDMLQAGGEALLGGVAHVEAGVFDAFGADGVAADIRSGADVLQDMAAANVEEAGAGISSGWDRLVGGDDQFDDGSGGEVYENLDGYE